MSFLSLGYLSHANEVEGFEELGSLKAGGSHSACLSHIRAAHVYLPKEGAQGLKFWLSSQSGEARREEFGS